MGFEVTSAPWSRLPLAANDEIAPRTVRPWLHDLPELRRAEDDIREAVLSRIGAFDATLIHEPNPRDWSDVLLAQIAPHRYVRDLHEHVQLVATPRYRAKGSDGPFNRSALLIRADDQAWGLEGVRGRRGAISIDDMNSAMLFEATAASASLDGRFFGSVTRFPAWPQALDALLEGDIDTALLDGVTLALLTRYRPKTVARLRVLAWTTSSPGAPLVTAKSTPPRLVEDMREALRAVERDPTLASARNALLIEGFNTLRAPHYRAVQHLQQIADSLGYAELR